MKDREQKGESVSRYLLGVTDLISRTAAGNYFFLEE